MRAKNVCFIEFNLLDEFGSAGLCPRKMPQTCRAFACKEMIAPDCGENSDAKHRASQGRKRNIRNRGCGPQLWPSVHILNPGARERTIGMRRFELRRCRHFRNVVGASLGAAWMPVTAWQRGNIGQNHERRFSRIGVQAGAAGMILGIGLPTGSARTRAGIRK